MPAIFLLALLTVCGLPAASSLAAGKSAAMVLDANTGAVLHADAADEPRYPASLTKMMTLYLVFEQLERGRLRPSTKIKFSAEAAAAPPTKMHVEAGEEIALIDAVKALITKSANDAAIAIAEHISGSEARFAELMTARARQLGMRNTVFRNASGLPDPEQVTTVRDMLTLALRLQDDFPKYYPLFATRSFTYGGHIYRNHNSLLGKLEGTDGIKTGYTHASGYNIVTSVRRGRKHLVGAVFGGPTASVRDARMRLLLTRAFVRASAVKTRQPQRDLVASAEARPRPVLARRPEGSGSPATGIQAVPAPVPAVRPAHRAPETPEAGPQPTIAIAKVRPVMVAPRAPEPAALPGYPAGLGAPPSTLEAQAANLSLGTPTPPVPVEVHRPVLTPVAAAAHAGSGFELQVGAYASSGEAERAVINARATAGGLLDPYGSRTLPVTRDNRQFFRARFTGFDAKTAASTCAELKKLQLDCLVMKPE